MNNIYFKKYLKYKNKYLSLKLQIEDQNAGAKMETLFKTKIEVNGITKTVEFGSIKDSRYEKNDRTGKLVPVAEVPYIKIDGQEHQIIDGFGESSNRKILNKIRQKNTIDLRSNEMIVYDKPCLTLLSRVNTRPVCNKKRGIKKYKFGKLEKNIN